MNIHPEMNTNSMEFKELKLIEAIANNWSIFVDLHPNNKGRLVSNDIVKEIYDSYYRQEKQMPMPTLKLGFDENIANLRSFLSYDLKRKEGRWEYKRNWQVNTDILDSITQYFKCDKQ